MTMIRTAAIALAALALSATAASAATYAWADQNTNVRAHHNNGSPVVNWLAEGQKVKVIGAQGNWYKIQIPGQDGWVRSNRLDFSPAPGPYLPAAGGSFCFGGQNASFCFGAHY